MNKLFAMLCLVGMTGWAQVKGNKEIKSITLPIDENLISLEMGLYANVTVDAGADSEYITITGDSNLLPLIDTEIVNGTMKLAQAEWIQPSQEISIAIGAPNLKKLQVSVHETVRIENVFEDQISLTALIGNIIAVGKVNKSILNAENGQIDAREMPANEASVNIWGRGKAIVNAAEVLDSKLSESARLETVGQPRLLKGDTKKALERKNEEVYIRAEYISLKIKNNSWNRNHFVVVGPKKDGRSFSYGFPMMPGATRKEHWTVGTKVYKKSKLGTRKLLVTIEKGDEGKTVTLFN